MRSATACRVFSASLLVLLLMAPSAYASGDDISSATPIHVGQSVSGTVGGGNVRDVWALTLAEGQEVTITVMPEGTPGGSARVGVLAPSAPSADATKTHGIITTRLSNGTYFDYGMQWAFTPARGGVYFVWVTQDQGVTGYTLSAVPTGNPPLTTLDADNMHGTPLGTGHHTGVVEARTDRNDVFAVRMYANQTVTLRLSPINNVWNNGAYLYVLDPWSNSVLTYSGWDRAKNADGSEVDEERTWAKMPYNPNEIAEITFTPPLTTTYYLWVKSTSIAGGLPYALDINGHADPAPARTKAYVRTPSAPSSIRRYGSFRAYGTVTRHPAGLPLVRINAYRYVSGRWSLYRAYSATLRNGPDSLSTYSASMYLPYRGTWRLIAQHPADSLHLTTSSGVHTILVK